jgi:transposase InsO family protein
MAFREWTVIEQREEFVRLALAPGANVSELARRFGIARSKANKWLKRYREEGVAGLAGRSRRPKTSPKRSAPEVEAAVLAIRAESNNAWGGRKINRVLARDTSLIAPSPSTVTAILRRHGKLEERAHEHPGPFTRFEHEAPNDLWQMDFKGHFATKRGRCHPLTVTDDHSRYCLVLQACAAETAEAVKHWITAAFRRYGLPHRILCDNSTPWASSGETFYTELALWIIRLGIGMSHGRPYHPQTQGKEERFHRSLKAEVLAGHAFDSLAHCQEVFERWRNRYNHDRPHDSLGLGVPAGRYRPSERAFPETLPEIDYGPAVIVKQVNLSGCIRFDNRSWCIGRGFVGQPVGLKRREDGSFGVYYCGHHLGDIDQAAVPKGGASPLIKTGKARDYPRNPRSSQASYPQAEQQKNV